VGFGMFWGWYNTYLCDFRLGVVFVIGVWEIAGFGNFRGIFLVFGNFG